VLILSFNEASSNPLTINRNALITSTSSSTNPLMYSRTAMLRSEKRVSTSISTPDSSSSFPSLEEYYEDGSDDILEATIETIRLQQPYQINTHYHPFEENENRKHLYQQQIELCSTSPVVKNLVRGAVLRIASDLTGGTPLENIKCRVQTTGQNIFQATQEISSRPGGILNLWSGTPSRTVEGALMGGVFLVASAATKKQVFAMGGSKTMAAFTAGVVGGVAQAIIMTPCGMVFTSLNVNKGKKGYENDTAITAAKRIIDKDGLKGLFVGGGPMAARQASNWASRSFLTELCRSNLNLSKYGLVGEISSGIIGGLGSCWNTPIETVRVLMQRDVSCGMEPKSFNGYIQHEMESGGIPSLFKGVSPRAIQAVWQTIFMVVTPTLLGL
jgi:hypothetical protein